MCTACVAQGAAYLVPAYALVKTTTWQRRRRKTRSDATPEPSSADHRPDELVDV